MNTDLLMRAADALMTALLWLVAGVGVLFAAALGHGVALVVALAFVLEGFVLARWVLRAPTS